MFSVQEATNEVNSEHWAGLSLVYSQDVEAFTRRRGEERTREKTRREERKGEIRGEKEIFVSTVQCSADSL